MAHSVDPGGAGIVIVGGGLAAAKSAEALRDQGYDGPLTVLAAESRPPYERPPLSKEHLTEGTPLGDFTPLGEGWYTDHDVDLRLGVTGTGIDRTRRTVTLADGSEVGYAKLVLATGARARRTLIPGADATGVGVLRTLEDSDAYADALARGARVAIIGAGWIGLEAAAAARGRDAAVTMFEIAEQPLHHVLGRRIGGAFGDLHRAHGVDLRLGVEVDRILTEDGRATGVATKDGERVEADFVLIGVGAIPNLELAQDAGLATSRGVLVDAGLRTEDPDVVAVGDVAEQDHPTFGRLRVEHWANALNQPAVAARSLLGQEASYNRVPYFFSDQYDLGMEYRGIAPDPDRVVVRGDLASAYLAFWLDADDRICAAMNVNDWDHGDLLADLVARRVRIEPTRLGDTTISLEDAAPAGTP